MAFFEWDPKFSVKIPEIDRQHRRLIGLINQLHEAMKPASQPVFDSALKELVTQASVINELVNYSHYHFSTEEKYMRMHRFPEYEGHKKEHESFIGEVRRFKDDFDSGKVVLSEKIMGFLRKWLGNHMLGTDKRYTPFLEGKELK